MKPTDAEILDNVINALDLSKRKFSIKLKYSSASTIYNIFNGTNSFSDDMKNRIRLTFPQVNRLYLDKGEGSVLLKGPQLANQENIENIFHREESKEVTSLEDLLFLPQQIKDIKAMVKRTFENSDSQSSDIAEIKEMLKQLLNKD